MRTVIDLNSFDVAARPFSSTIDALLDGAAAQEARRTYLGASAIGNQCLRRIQFSWMCDPQHPLRRLDIFARGHFFETRSRAHLEAAGFKFAPAERLAFSALDGLFQGHADGILIAGPELPDLRFPALWEHKCLNAKGWREIGRKGLTGLHAPYAAQVALYQAYLDVTNPALLTVTNPDTCERLHFTVPFDARLAQEASDRAFRIVEATRAGDMLERVADDPDDWRCGMCEWRARCWGAS
jgi:hypothetical protein